MPCEKSHTPSYEGLQEIREGKRGTDMDWFRDMEIQSVTCYPMKQPVGLHKAEISWSLYLRTRKELYIAKPHDEELATERLLCKMRSILNKITPQKFCKLICQTQEFNINSEKALTEVADLIFNKAMSEPNFHLPCALICKTLSGVAVDNDFSDDDPVTFHVALKARCHVDVKDNEANNIEANKRQSEIEDEDDAKKREMLEFELEELKAKSRRRKTCKSRFFGELFKLKMKTERSMHRSAITLFGRMDEESLECLCVHFTAFGKILDRDDDDDAKTLMDSYFVRMQTIIDEQLTSTRIRFMLMDVIDLRQNNWVPRRPTNDDKIVALFQKHAAKKERKSLLEALTCRSLYNRSEQDLIEHRRFWLNLRLPRYARRTPVKDRKTIDQVQKQAAAEQERKATMMAAQEVYWSNGLIVDGDRIIQLWMLKNVVEKISTDSDQEKSTEKLFRKMRDIINQIIPENFAQLIGEVQELEINTETRLTGVIDLIFEKAIDLPNFSPTYALLCKTLSGLVVQPEGDIPGAKPITFRVKLLARCQEEFEKDGANEIELGKREAEIHAEDDAMKKKMFKLEFKGVQFKYKRRLTGYIGFIFELFKLNMLPEKIMHQCLTKLLQQKDEESLECLCCLLKAIGKGIEQNTSEAKTQMDSYFIRMQTIIDEKLTSTRIRFLMMDVIDLRQNNWVPRRTTNDSKTIDRIDEDG